MTTILPSARTPFDSIMEQMGQQLGHNLPQVMQQRGQREMGLSAIDQLQQQLENSGGDISKMLPAIARAYSLNPNLERSGIAEQALMKARATNRYGQPSAQPQQTGQSQGQPQSQNQGQPNYPSPQMSQGQQQVTEQPQQGFQNSNLGPAQTAYNIKTPEQISAEAERRALINGDPNEFQRALTELDTQNAIAINYKTNLENMAKRGNVSPDDLPEFMQIGSKYDTTNPDQWFKNTERDWLGYKNNRDKLQKAFIPGIGHGLMGKNRDAALKKLEPTVQEEVKAGREPQTRAFLASEYVTPTEIDGLIHPIQPDTKKAIENLPKGFFPPNKKANWQDVKNVFKGKLPSKHENPFVSYEDALEKAPKEMEIMQNRLSDFFLKNVKPDTPLLVLRDELWDGKDYDWRQIGPAIREAEKKGLQLTPQQRTDLTTAETDAPRQSLPDIFRDWGNMVDIMSGAK